MAFWNRRVNKVLIDGNNNVVIQLIGENGEIVKNSFPWEVFLSKFTDSQTERIEEQKALIAALNTTGEYYLRDLGIAKQQIVELEKEKAEIESRLLETTESLAAKDLTTATTLYQEALAHFMKGDLDATLLVLEDAKIEEKLQKARRDYADERLLKARAYELKRMWREAGENYAMAANGCPEYDVIHRAAEYFHRQNRHEMAADFFRKALLLAENENKKAGVLNNLAVLLRSLNELVQSRAHYEESLQIYRRLAEGNPEAYIPDVAMALNNLGILLRSLNELVQSRAHYEESLQIRRRLAAANPEAYLPDVAMTLNNLGILLSSLNELVQSRAHYEESLQMYRRLAEANAEAYLPDVAMTAINLSIFHIKDDPDRDLSIAYAKEAILASAPLFESLPTAEKYTETAIKILQHWGVDLTSFLKDLEDKT